MTTTTDLLADYSAASVSLASVAPCAADLAALPDAALLEAGRVAAENLRLAQKTVAVFAAETAVRSAPELGHAGLAQKAGFRTPELMVRATTGSTLREASTSIRVGGLMRHSAQLPWLEAVGAAVDSGAISVGAADAIRSGLGAPSASVSAQALAAAANELCASAAHLDPDRLFKRAREARDSLDVAGVAEREHALYEARGLRLFDRPNGMTHASWEMDPLSAARFRELYDRATSPKRGGPRFVGGSNAQLADDKLRDERTAEQLASDVMLQLLESGADADSSQLLGTGGPVVRILVTADDLEASRGFGVLEGNAESVSIATVEAAMCSATSVEVTVDRNGKVLDLGREQRLYSRLQRIALAARDGGCMWGDCERPPSWCEAHHIKHWKRDGGRTDIDEGVLLCKHHHLVLHDHGWEIVRDGGEYYLVPPATIDPQRTRRHLPSKSRALRRALTQLEMAGEVPQADSAAQAGEVGQAHNAAQAGEVVAE